MLVELHILQNFAPSNLNRDDTGSPKDCEFGGYRRARVSSQCLKRAIRREFETAELLPPTDRAIRTKRLVDEVEKRLTQAGKDREQAVPVIRAALGGLGLSVKDDGKTQYLLYLGEREIAAVTDFCFRKWDALAAVAPGADAAAGKRATKKAARDALTADDKKVLLSALDGGKAADLALFGRMLADLPDHNVDAACQVAHALSSHRVSMEFDYYTAIDDLKPEETAAADMIGTIEFNSATFYRYANVDTAQLVKNLQGDDNLARRTLEAFLHASVRAVPSGKQNSMAAQNPPSFLLGVVRDHTAWSLANAFLRPVVPVDESDLMERSITALDAYWGNLVGMYGAAGIRRTAAATYVKDGLQHLADALVPDVDAWVQATVEAVQW